MRTILNFICADWTRVKNHCRTTVNKGATDVDPSDKFKRDLLISEHSPIRMVEVDWTWPGIKSWVATHWSRHKFEKFISTQRDDRTGEPRDSAPQSAPVTFDGYANAQQLIDAWRKRLCYKAHDETRKLASDFKITLENEGQTSLADMLVPNCVYRMGCPEFKTCGHFERFLRYASIMGYSKEDLYNINTRYIVYAMCHRDMWAK